MVTLGHGIEESMMRVAVVENMPNTHIGVLGIVIEQGAADSRLSA